MSPCRACARGRHLQHPRVCTRGAAGGRLWHRLVALAAARCGDAASSTTAARQRAPHLRGSKAGCSGDRVDTGSRQQGGHHRTVRQRRSQGEACDHPVRSRGLPPPRHPSPRRAAPAASRRRPASGAARSQSCTDASYSLPTASRRVTGLARGQARNAHARSIPRMRAGTARGVAIPGPRDRRNR
jgi:hypothetical protein